MSTLCYSFHSFFFFLTPSFTPSPLRLSSATAAVICRWNTISNTQGKTLVQLPISRVLYARRAASLLVAPLDKIEMDQSKPLLPFGQVVHCERFPAHYAQSCLTGSLLTLSSSYRISDSVLILCHSHHLIHLLLSPSSRLSTTSLLLISPVALRLHHYILCHPYLLNCHLMCLLPLY